MLKETSAIAVLTEYGYGFKTKVLEAAAEGCWSIIPKDVLDHIPSNVRPFCIPLNTKSSESFIEALNKTKSPLPSFEKQNTELRSLFTKSFIGILFLFNIFCAVAQKSDSSGLDTLSVWKLKSLYSLSGTQSSFVNWNAGGRNNISLIGNIRASADYNKAKWNWSSDATLAFGGIKYLDDVQGVDLQKTDDKIDLSSIVGMRISKRFLISLNSGFKTQFADGFTYPNDSVAVSTFMAPGYLNLALGTDYIKDANFSVFGSPFASKTTLVMDDSLSQLGAFGVEKGERIRHEFGAFIKLKWNSKLMKNIDMKLNYQEIGIGFGQNFILIKNIMVF